MRTRCTNKELHGTGWYQTPDMIRLYIRTSTTTRDTTKPGYHTNTKRAWVPVGVICPEEKCRRIILDEIASEVEGAS